MRGRSTSRTIGGILVATLLVGGLITSPAEATTYLSPPMKVVPTAKGYLGSLLGQAPSGDVFVVARNSLGLPGAFVIHADGSTGAELTNLTYPSTDSVIGPDGRLWVPQHQYLRAYGTDGVGTSYPIPTMPGASAPVLFDVQVGADGRMWFADWNGDRIGAMDTDGTGIVTYALPIGVQADRLVAGPDGRMWSVGTRGQLDAFTPAGVHTSYPSIGDSPSLVRSFAGSLWSVVSGSLLRIEPDGTRSTVARIWGTINNAAVRDMEVANGRLWVLDDTETFTGVTADGAVVRAAAPAQFDSLSEGELPVSMAATPSGDLVGTSRGRLWRWDDPAPGPQLTVVPTLVEGPGTSTLHLEISALTSAGVPIRNPVFVNLWYRRVQGHTLVESSFRGVTVVEPDAAGHATLDLLVRPGVLPVPGPGELRCCSVAVALSGIELPVTSRRIDVIGAPHDKLAPTEEVRYLDTMHGVAIGRPMDTTGLRYWAARLANGTSTKKAVAASIVASSSWRNHRVTDAYRRWLGRTPDASGLTYWSTWLATHTTTELDQAIGGTAAGRDAEGTTNAKRATHLRKALGLAASADAGFATRLNAGVRWSVVLRDGYATRAAFQARIVRSLGPTLAPASVQPRLIALLQASGDERDPLLDRLPAA